MKTSDIEVTLVDHCGSDLSVVNAARVSFNKVSTELNIRDEKLIRYLAQHKHFSPFNHSFISVRVKAPIFVARQLVKHKFMPWNEVSRRYVDEEPEFYFPAYWRKKADNVKQGSSDEKVEDARPAVFNDMCVQDCLYAYKEMLRVGYCPEQARMVLPQNTMTEWIWSGTLGAFCDMLRLRLDPHTQKETMIVANKVKEIITPLFPISVKELLDA
jgi:thymidylate synthase (FAD)